MTLGEVVSQLPGLEDEATVYAAKPWTERSNAVCAIEGSDEARAAMDLGLSYLLEVHLIREVAQVWSSWRAGAVPSTEDLVVAVIYYAENDAYLAADPR